MLALVVSVLFALYALGPDLVSRWILGFFFPRKTIAQSKSEEVSRAILWALVPFGLALSIRHVGPWPVPPISASPAQTFFSSIYSESFFDSHQQQFFASAEYFALLNARLLARMYIFVVGVSVLFDIAIWYYGRLRSLLRNHPWLRNALAILVLPRISEWHAILSPVLLPNRRLKVRVDVLTKGGILYDGALREKMLSGNGDLQSVTLEKPRRFRREEFLEARKADAGVKTDGYWKEIPGESFVILAAEISTLNIRHVPDNVVPFSRDEEIKEALAKIRELVAQATSQLKPERGPQGQPH